MEYTEEKVRNIAEALEDESFKAVLSKAQSPEEIKARFLERGQEVDDEFAQSAYDKIDYLRNGGELTEEELELVAGGSWAFWGAVVGAGLGFAATGNVGGALVGAAAGYIIGWAIDVSVAQDNAKPLLAKAGVKTAVKATKKRR